MCVRPAHSIDGLHSNPVQFLHCDERTNAYFAETNIRPIITLFSSLFSPLPLRVCTLSLVVPCGYALYAMQIRPTPLHHHLRCNSPCNTIFEQLGIRRKRLFVLAIGKITCAHNRRQRRTHSAQSFACYPGPRKRICIYRKRVTLLGRKINRGDPTALKSGLPFFR